MAQRLLGVVLASACLLVAVLVLPAAAHAATGCVTKVEYDQVKRGMTYPQVERLVGAHHVDASSGGAGAVVWTYRACDARYEVQVTYQVPQHGSGTVFTKRITAA